MRAVIAAGVVVGWVALAVWATSLWRRQRTTSAGMLAAAFAALAMAILISRLRTHAGIEVPAWPQVLLVLNGILAVFPWAVAAAVWSLSGRRPRWARIGTIGVPALLVWLVALSVRAEPPEAERVAFLVLFVGLWSVAAVGTAAHLVRAGRRYPLARPRMTLIAVGLLATNAALLADVVSGTTGSSLARLAMNVLALLAGAVLLAGFAAPRPLRWWWRRGSAASFQRMQTELLAALSRHDVASAVTPRLMQLLGAGVAVVADDGEVLDRAGIGDNELQSLVDGLTTGGRLGADVRTASIGPGWLVVVTHPYTPVFGRDELQMLDAYALHVRIALERAQLFESVTTQQRDLEAMLLGLAHDIRNPATMIRGFVELLADTDAAEERAELRDHVVSSTAYLDRLVDAMLELAHANDAAGEQEPVELVGVARQLASRLRAAHPDVRIDVRGEPTVALLRPVQAEQLLDNLLANAVKHGGRSDLTIDVEVATRHGSIELVVADDGIGVDATDRQRIFAPFQRGTGAASRGNGVGLGLVSRITERLGGTVTLEASDRGARFVIRLPQRLLAEPRTRESHA